MITRVKIDGYKSFQNFELTLGPITVVFGPNASGKSNLFDALKLISAMATEKKIANAFKEQRGSPLESIFVGGRGNSDFAKLSFEVDVRLSDDVIRSVENKIRQMRGGLDEKDYSSPSVTEKNLRYNLDIAINLKSGEARVENEQLCALTKRGEKRSRKAFIEKVEDKLRLRMERQSHPLNLDVGLDYTVVSSRPYAPHHPHINAFHEELSRWKFYYLEPKTLMRADSNIIATEMLGSSGEGLADFYYYLSKRDPKKYQELELLLNSLIPNLSKIEAKPIDEVKVRLSIKELNHDFPIELMSEGTIRLLGFVGILNSKTPLSVLGFEEPENGVHPKRLKVIADMLKWAAKTKGIQIIVNTHSVEFVELFDDSELFVCKKPELRTIISPLKDEGPLFRRTLIREGLSDLSE